MIAASDADRAKAAEVVGPWWDFVATSEYAGNLRDLIAVALAEARAPYDRLTADLRALAEELERDAAAEASLHDGAAFAAALTDAALRLRHVLAQAAR